MSFGDDFVDPFFEFLCLKNITKGHISNLVVSFFVVSRFLNHSELGSKIAIPAPIFRKDFFPGKHEGFLGDEILTSLPSLKLT